MMKSDPFVQYCQYLHQLQYDANVNTVLTDDNKMTPLDLIIAFRQSCITTVSPSHHHVVCSLRLRASLMFRRRCLSLLYLCMCVCFAFIPWMFLLSLFLPVVPRILPHTQSGSERLRVLLQNQGAEEEMAGAVWHGIVSVLLSLTVCIVLSCFSGLLSVLTTDTKA